MWIYQFTRQANAVSYNLSSDPPLVIQLNVPDGVEKDYLHSHSILCNVTLVSVDCVDNSILKRLKITCPIGAMFGQTCQNGLLMYDFNSTNKTLFFCFPDLSLRVKGSFRLSCQFVDVNKYLPHLPSRNWRTDPVITSPFQVYPPKSFPGMLKNTELSRYLFQNGGNLKINRSSNKEEGLHE